MVEDGTAGEAPPAVAEPTVVADFGEDVSTPSAVTLGESGVPAAEASDGATEAAFPQGRESGALSPGRLFAAQ